MALFKAFRGMRESLDEQELHDGHAYFCTDDGTFHIDYVDSEGNLQRKQINADTITGSISSAQVTHGEGLFSEIIDNKVEKIEGKSLSTNDFTDEYMAKLDILQPTYSLYTNISLLADNWVGTASPYSQTVTINGITDNSRVELCPSIEQLSYMGEHGISLMAINDNSIVTIYALNNKPTTNLDMQVTVSDVIVLQNAEDMSI